MSKSTTKCRHRWEDPAQGRGSFIGPFACGRPPGHRGDHAFQGDIGEWALWKDDGTLVLAAGFSSGPQGSAAQEAQA